MKWVETRNTEINKNETILIQQSKVANSLSNYLGERISDALRHFLSFQSRGPI